MPDEPEIVQVIEGVAAGEVTEAELATWIEKFITPR